MAKLGFLGLGIMGYPMARNLVRAGHQVAVWSNTGSKARELAASEKAVACETPAQVAEFAECTFVCVGNTRMSEQVILGANGVVAGAKPGTVVADASTVAPSYARRVGAALRERGVEFLDAPCTGSKPGAEGGTLTFMVGGDLKIYEKVKPFFEPMGKQLYYCGPQGMGLHAKLSQNLLLSNMLQAINESLVLAAKAGMDPDLMLDILQNSAAKSGLLAFKAPFVFDRNFVTNFSIKWMHKDIGLMLESAEEMEVPLPLTGLTQQLFRAAIAAGYGEEDICATIKVLEGIAGVEVKRKSKK